MAAITRKYNPNFLSCDDHVATFCVRRVECESLIEALGECSGSANTHQIVIGPRGSGKTSLLLRVEAEVLRDADLSTRFFPIVFAEESYEVSTTGEFWLECLSRLASQAPPRDDFDLQRTFEGLHTIREDRTLEDRCLGVLLDFADQEEKRLVLIVENLNMLFRDMIDEDAGWRLRKVLQTEPRIILLASATSRFDQIDNPGEALYELFRVIRLRPLDTEDCMTLWRAVSGQAQAPQKIQALRILTGGSPRLLTIVARFGAHLSFLDLMADLLNLVDDQTEYFKSHLDALPAQERKVYLALAVLWKPATAREIADRARIETSKCSAQLARLVERGAVEVSGGSARRKLYYLTERLYNIYYLMRRARGQAPFIDALIRFMDAYYSADDLRESGARMARDAPKFHGGELVLCRLAFDRLIRLSSLEPHRDDPISIASPTLLYASSGTDLLKSAQALAESGRLQDAVAAWDKAVQEFGKNHAPESQKLVASALIGKSGALIGLNRHREALKACDEVLERFDRGGAPALHGELAAAMVGRGHAFHRLNQVGEAADAWGAAVERFGTSDSPRTVEQVASALANLGAAHVKSGRLEDALTVFEEVIRNYGTRDTPFLREVTAKSFVNRGKVLAATNRKAEALSSWEEAIRGFEAGCSPESAEPHCYALMAKAAALHHKGRSDEALGLWGHVAERFGSNGQPGVLVMVAKALTNKATLREQSRCFEEALGACDDALQLLADCDEIDGLQAVAQLLVDRGFLLVALDRSEEGKAAWDEVICRFEASDVPALRDPAESALCMRAQQELIAGRAETSVTYLDRALLPTRLGLAERRLEGHLLRARAHLTNGNADACAEDTETALSIVPELNALPSGLLFDLADLAAGIGMETMCDLIRSSPIDDLLLPLRTAFEKELGLSPRVAREVEEVAEDVRRNLLARPVGKTG